MSDPEATARALLDRAHRRTLSLAERGIDVALLD